MSCRIIAGALVGDEIEDESVTSVFVRPLHRKGGFPTYFGFRILAALAGGIHLCRTAHIAFARELIPLCGALIAILLRKAVILQPHGMLTVGSGPSRAKNAIDACVVGPLLRRATTIIALTDVERYALANRFRLDASQIVVIGNGVNIREKPFVTSEPRRLNNNPEMLFCARLHPRKRVADFIVAAQILGSHVRAVVVGPDGGDLEVVLDAQKQKIISYEQPVQSSLLPFRVAQTDVFVLCSEHEPWGNVLVIALALYVPVVVTRSADLAASIDQAGAGIIVDDASPASIAAAVAFITADQATYHEFSANAGRLARARFSHSFTEQALLDASRRAEPT